MPEYSARLSASPMIFPIEVTHNLNNEIKIKRNTYNTSSSKIGYKDIQSYIVCLFSISAISSIYCLLVIYLHCSVLFAGSDENTDEYVDKN